MGSARSWIGKMSAFFVLGLVDSGVSVMAGVWIFDVPFRGRLVELAFVVFLFLFGALCWGLLISAATRSQLLAYQVGIVTSFLPAFLLSGFVYAIENMPAPVQVITHIVPARYFVASLQTIFLAGDIWPLLWRSMGMMAAIGALLFTIAIIGTRKRLD